MHRNPDILRAVIHAPINGDNTIVPAVAGKAIVVVHYHITAKGDASSVVWKSGSTPLTGQDGMSLPADGSFVHGEWIEKGHFLTQKGQPLVLNATAKVEGYLSYLLTGD